jgi:stage V sporulation protein S
MDFPGFVSVYRSYIAARRCTMEMIKVSAQSRSTAVAGAIAGVMRERKYVEVQAIGASAVNQAIKAVAIARDYLALDGIPIVCIPEFVEVDIDGQERTAIKLIVEPRYAS